MTLSAANSVCASVPGLTAEEEQSLSAYGQLPSFEHLSLSPDGLRLAYIGTVGAERHILVKNVADGRKLLDFTANEGQKVRGLQWADDTHILATVSMATAASLWGGEWGEYFGVIAADLGTGQAWDVLKFPGGAANNKWRVGLVFGRVRARQIQGETWLFLSGAFTDQGSQFGRMMKINLSKRSHTIIETPDLDRQYDQLLDENGNFVAISGYDLRHRSWQIKVGAGGSLRPAMSGVAELDLPTLLGISPDGQHIWLTIWNNGIATQSTLLLADGKTVGSGIVTEGKHLDSWSYELLDRRNDRVVAGAIEDMDGSIYDFLDARLNSEWQAVVKSLKGARPQIISANDAYSVIIVQIQTSAGPTYLSVDMPNAKTSALGPEYRRLPAVAEVRSIQYTAQDGLLIPGYLTLPLNRNAKNLPLVVMPHGGPSARDYLGFDWWAQALANEGYAVLQSNFRGSSVSDASVAAGHGEWGRKMQTDLSDGVKYLGSQGLIDQKRVCIVGASYGGYAALAGVSLQHDIYRCAVSVAGLSDLHHMVEPSLSVHTEDNYGARYWERWLGVTNVNDPSVDDRSPLRHANDVNVPVLLIHGRDDVVVPYKQSRWMADALKRLNKPCELIDLQAEDHWLSHSDTRVQMLANVTLFLKTNNPPDSPIPADSKLH